MSFLLDLVARVARQQASGRAGTCNPRGVSRPPTSCRSLLHALPLFFFRGCFFSRPGRVKTSRDDKFYLTGSRDKRAHALSHAVSQMQVPNQLSDPKDRANTGFIILHEYACAYVDLTVTTITFSLNVASG